MKLLKFIDVCKSLLELHSLRTSNTSIVMNYDRIQLSTGNEYRVLSGGAMATRLEFYLSEYRSDATLVQVSRQMDLHIKLRDDHYFLMNEDNLLQFGILKETTGVLNMMAVYLPFIDNNVPHDQDTLEALEFQYLTKYSINEVQAMIVYHILNGYRKDYPAHTLTSKYNPSLVINFKVLDECTEEELDEINNKIREQINGIQLSVLSKI
ncbi:hypothetical protein [Yersinia phage fHe-Yen9-04]|uniref:Uncharacterized protein n=1 Tax=Yersinia phage fHe-Yen9-04 TaxID=2052742 RepID=A0A2C9CWU4_9CAUD|nr:hypothetical protein FDJ41_gp030 [Yersinia phage fHe-Yen9-04]SOK58307.1 hypothetical protein [Yersinia phage fHe-Yen9-04]VUE36076.1 hypothetical protein [Yersinia phage fHe-Yen9-04]